MFRGASAVNMDVKGRLNVPAKYREVIEAAQSANQLIVTIDIEQRCLLAYLLKDWEVIERKLQALPNFDAHTRRIQRLLIGHATEVELDGSGRLLVPPLLREYAELDKRVILVGQGPKFEIWAESLWESGRKQWLASMSAEELPAELKSISI